MKSSWFLALCGKTGICEEILERFLEKGRLSYKRPQYFVDANNKKKLPKQKQVRSGATVNIGDS